MALWGSSGSKKSGRAKTGLFQKGGIKANVGLFHKMKRHPANTKVAHCALFCTFAQGTLKKK